MSRGMESSRFRSLCYTRSCEERFHQELGRGTKLHITILFFFQTKVIDAGQFQDGLNYYITKTSRWFSLVEVMALREIYD